MSDDVKVRKIEGKTKYVAKSIRLGGVSGRGDTEYEAKVALENNILHIKESH